MSKTPSYSSTASSSKLHDLPEGTPDDDEIVRTKVLLIGSRRSGKTSIQQVLFNNLSPKNSFFLETTTNLTKYPVDTIIPIEIWDCPGNITVGELGAPMSSFSSIVFVVDIQDSFHQAVSKLLEFTIATFQENPDINLDVFVHKAEALTDDFRFENFRHFQSRVQDELSDMPPFIVHLPSVPGSNAPPEAREFIPEQIQINYHLTSIYDHSTHEAFSRVIQGVLTNTSLPFLEDLLNIFCANSHASKAFLFDMNSNVYVATDSSPVDNVRHDLCCDYLTMLGSFGPLYRSQLVSPSRHPRRCGVQHNREIDPNIPVTAANSLPTSVSPSTKTSSSPGSSGSTHSNSVTASPSTITAPPPAALRSGASSIKSPSTSEASASSTTPPSTSSSDSSLKHDDAGDAGSRPDSDSGKTSLALAIGSPTYRPKQPPMLITPPSGGKPLFYPSAATSLLPDTTLIYHVVTPQLALLAMLPTGIWQSRRGLVEYNVVYLREGIQEICAVERDSRRKSRASHPSASTVNRKR